MSERPRYIILRNPKTGEKEEVLLNPPRAVKPYKPVTVTKALPPTPGPSPDAVKKEAKSVSGQQQVLLEVPKPAQPTPPKPKYITLPSPITKEKEEVLLTPPFYVRPYQPRPQFILLRNPETGIKEVVNLRPSAYVRPIAQAKTEIKPNTTYQPVTESETSFAPRLNYKVNIKTERPLKKVKEKTEEIFIDRKQEPVLLFFQEVPIVSLIQQRFAELVNKFFGAQEYKYAPVYKKTVEVGKYTASKDVNAKKMYTVNDFYWHKKDNYSPGGNIPLVPIPPLPNAGVYNISPESEVIIAPTAKLTVKSKPPQPIVKTTSQVITYLQSLINESEYWG